MGETVLERVRKAQALIDGGKSVAKACKLADIASSQYYAKRKMLSVGEPVVGTATNDDWRDGIAEAVIASGAGPKAKLALVKVLYA